MFDKILSVLPYNPSLVHQLAFYSKRMRQETTIRRTGILFLILAFVVQFMAVMSPPQSTVAASNNDLVNGGFSSASQAASICSQNVAGYGTILANYGVTCAKVAAAPTIYIHSTDFSRQLFSMGRLPYNIAGETPVNIGGATYYVRYLWGWDTGPPSSYEALNVTSTGGQTILLLYACGNLTSVGLPKPITPPKPVVKPPALTISKTTLSGYPTANSQVQPGTTLGYRIFFRNGGGVASNVSMKDPIPAHTTYSSLGSGGANSYSYNSASNAAEWIWNTIPVGANNDYTDLLVKVDANTANGTQICNVATIGASGVSPISSNQVCVKVVVPITGTPVPTQPLPVPSPCKYDSSILASNSLCIVCPYNDTIIKSSPNCKPPIPVQTCPYDSSLPLSSSMCVVCPYNSTIIKSNTQCKPCEASLSSEDTLACVVVHKTAADLTQGIANANGITAQPNDEILYTLYANNGGKATVKGYLFQEQLSDTLDYANVENLYGGTMDATDEVTWPTIDIAPGQTATEQVEVKVMSVIPQTPVSSSDPEHYNLVMTNVYGNTVNINVPGSLQKTIETANTQLVNTGPGTSLYIAASIVILAGYFFARSRLLSKEAVIAIQDNINGSA